MILQPTNVMMTHNMSKILWGKGDQTWLIARNFTLFVGLLYNVLTERGVQFHLENVLINTLVEGLQNCPFKTPRILVYVIHRSEVRSSLLCFVRSVGTY